MRAFAPDASRRASVCREPSERGREVARGLSAYDSDAARRIAGRRSAEIEDILGWRGRDVIVHRDDLVVV